MSSEVTKERVKYIRESRNFAVPILKILQDNGGELSEIQELDRFLPNYTDITEDEINYSKITSRGNKYTPYLFGRNFAVRNLEVAGLVVHKKGSSVKLTQSGYDADVNDIGLTDSIYDKTATYWKNKIKENRAARSAPSEGRRESDDESGNETDQEWRAEILDKVKSLDAYKFESFSRGLLSKMGFDVDSLKGTKKSGDGGIDGFAYCLDRQSLKTTRVVIQCKKFTNSSVGSVMINELRGAVDTHRAEYGIFITTSYFSRDAIQSARSGGTPITLVDGKQLVDLMIKYSYKVEQVISYAPDEEYFQ